MKDGLRFVDSDMHVMEPPDLFDRYLDPKFRDRVSVRVDENGRPIRGPAGTILIDGEPTSDQDVQQYRKPRSAKKTKVITPTSGSRLQETDRLDFAIERDYSPEAQVMGMAIEGVDIAVLYPTMGLGLHAPYLTLTPKEYFRRNCWAAVEGSEPEIESTAALIGADRMCVSTDYPHFDSNFPNVANNVLKGCSRDTAAKILAGGAGIYGFTEADFEKADKAAAGLTISVQAKPTAVQAA